jgi:ribosomal protein S18 acetylase RimI-like enzyme
MYVASDHSRVLALWQRGVQTVPITDGAVEFDALECIGRRQWCEESQVDEIADLESRVVEDSEYESIWIRRCRDARQRLKTEPLHGLRIVVEEDGTTKSKICDEILRALPEWFGIEESIVEYVADVETLPFYVAELFGTPVGFCATTDHFGRHADLHVLGIFTAFHGRGIGTAMLDEVSRSCLDRGIRYLTVKTLDASHPDENYAATRKFYEGYGFEPFEVLPTLWGEANPCLMMIKELG